MENLGFDSWIIPEAPDPLIDPPADCRTKHTHTHTTRRVSGRGVTSGSRRPSLFRKEPNIDPFAQSANSSSANVTSF